MPQQRYGYYPHWGISPRRSREVGQKRGEKHKINGGIWLNVRINLRSQNSIEMSTQWVIYPHCRDTTHFILDGGSNIYRKSLLRGKSWTGDKNWGDNEKAYSSPPKKQGLTQCREMQQWEGKVRTNRRLSMYRDGRSRRRPKRSHPL